nr:hypothetical protein [Bacteroidota bacterium]
MQQFNTLNDLIFFAYNESDIPNANEYHKLIDADQKLTRQYRTVLKLKNGFRKLKVGPSEITIRNILNYSSALSVTNTKCAGKISLLLN